MTPSSPPAAAAAGPVPATAARSTLRQRLARTLRPVFKPTRSALLPGPWRYFWARPVPFEVWFRARAAWFLLTRRWGVTAESSADSVDHHERIVAHNFGNRWLFNRLRTEKLMNVLRSVGSVSRSSRILVIGPRNEAELLLLSLYGFRLENIVGIDLLTYSPRIRRMDMHALEFPDDSFDVVYTLYTLPYAHDLSRACGEIIRVLCDGGVVAAGFQHTPTSSKQLRSAGSELHGGLDELLACFGTHVDHVFWQELDPTGVADNDYRATTIFRIRKP